MTIHPVTAEEYRKVISLLQLNHLPADDITDSTRLFTFYKEGELAGVVGIEIKEDSGLLRSLCVAERQRSTGIGKKLVDFIEAYAKEQGLKNLYLLTTTAAPFFAARSYQTIDRTLVPLAIRETSEFASVCPSTATVMKKELGVKVV